MSDIADFLASVPMFREVPADQLAQIAPLFREAKFQAGEAILRQGGYSQAVYFLRTGRLAVRVQKLEGRQTVAYLQPPAVFGELSFITGRACSADVEVVVDADVIYLPKEAMVHLPAQREAILRGMMRVVAERLHDTVTKGAKAAESPVILVCADNRWEAPFSFAAELCRSLARQTQQESLVVILGQAGEPRKIGPKAWTLGLAVDIPDDSFRGAVARELTEWKHRYTNVVLNPVGAKAAAIAGCVSAFADYRGDLVGPTRLAPEEEQDSSRSFVVASSFDPHLALLKGNRQLIWEAAESEKAWLADGEVTERFRRTVDSIARFISGTQVGIALGGGAAWGWAHIGVLEVIENAGIPIDVISGCSMGSVIGALRSSGVGISELREIACYWSTRTRRFVEWRLWRFCLVNEIVARKVFGSYFGSRTVNQTEIPYWANAVDIKTGKEFTIVDGTLVDAVRASIALPGLLPPFARGPHLLVDAGIMDPVPVNLVRRMGCRYAIAVNAMARLESQTMSTRYPMNMFDVMLRCMRVTGHEIGQARCEESADIVITPKLGSISMLDFANCNNIMESGRKVAEENISTILAGYDRARGWIAGPVAAEVVRN
ncbi:MAG: patatin-like phospholipase family protein [Bryobacteraceae bacterium]